MDGACVITRKTLGRSASLCDLYDVRRDVFCGVSLLNSKPPEATITSVEVPDIYGEYTTEHTYHDKFNKFNIEGSLKISVLTGLLELSGTGKYLKDESSSQKEVRGTLIYKITTTEESVNLLQNELRPRVVMSHFRGAEATHVVSKIKWGAYVFVTFSKKTHDSSKAKEIAGDLQAILAAASEKVASGNCKIEYSGKDKPGVDNFSIKVQGDVVPDEAVPQSVEQVLLFMSMIPQYVKKYNQGKGKPLEIELYPINLLANHFGYAIETAKLKNEIDEARIMTVESVIDSSVHQKQILNDFLADVRDFQEHVSGEDLAECSQYQQRVDIADAEFLGSLKTATLAIRQEGAVTSVLDEALEKYRLNPDGTHMISIFMNKKSALKAKMDFFQVMKEKNVDFLPTFKSIHSFVAQHDKKDIYVLYYSDALLNSDKEKWQHTYLVFLELIKERNGSVGTPDYGVADEITKFLVVDVELHDHNGGPSILIEQYSNGRLSTSDVVNDKCSAVTQNIIMWEHIHKIGRCLQTTAVVKLICPLAIESKCKADRRQWVCYRCNHTMEYNLCDLFYCNCGGVLLQDCRFKCCDPSHGSQYRSFVSPEKLKENLPQLSGSNQANILLLGQTGVGKTMWINALRNYLEYPRLQDAIEGTIESGVKMLSSSTFVHRGTTVLVGKEDSQEASTVAGAFGVSSTRCCRSHYFKMSARSIQIIDTPGIGDTRGINDDELNMKHILKYIEQEDQLHGICIFLKPDECRLSEHFVKCLTKLLMILHKNAGNNIMFCYTHSRSTLFDPGNTDSLVRSMIRDIRKSHNKSIPYNDKNTFYFDSEPFNLLAGIQSEILFSEKKIQTYSESWDDSQKHCVRLLETILDVDPHVVVETVSLNDARKLIVLLSGPLEDINSVIEVNIRNRKSECKTIVETKEEGARLEACLYRNIEHLDVTPLKQPRTVCTAESCLDHVNANIDKCFTEYRICHEQCSGCIFQGVLNQGGWQMRFCTGMNWLTGNCRICHCSYLLHRQVTCNTQRIQERITVPSVEKQIKENRSTMDIVQSTIDDLNKEITELQEERKEIMSALTGFAVFVNENALFAVDTGVTEKWRLCSSWFEHNIFEKLRDFLPDHVEEEEVVQTLSHPQSFGRIRPEDILKIIANLEKLPKYGNKLREQVQKSKTCTSSRHEAYLTDSTNCRPKLMTENVDGSLQKSFEKGKIAFYTRKIAKKSWK